MDSLKMSTGKKRLDWYRVSHLVIDVGLVDFDFSVPPFCPAAKPLLPSAQFPPAEAELGRQWNNQNASQPNLVYDQMGRLVGTMIL